MKIAIVGSSGYIAKHLMKAFSEQLPGCEILKIDMVGEVDIPLQLTVPAEFEYDKLKSFDYVIFTAAISGPDMCANEFDKCWNINVTGTSYFIRETIKRDVKVLFFSSDAAFGDIPGHIYDEDSVKIQTRDILLAHFLTADGQDLAILVNHHPSKYGGAILSEQRRLAAVKRLRQLTDSLKQCGIDRIVAMGDFNDTPESPLYNHLDLTNLSKELHDRGEGSIRFEGKWELIDQIFVSESLKGAKMRIIRAPFLMVRDKKYTGEKPFRTYSGPRYLGGVSDHCPVWMDYKAPINYPDGRKNAKE